MTKITYYTTSLLEDNLSLEKLEGKILRYCDLLNNIIDNKDEIRIPLQIYGSSLDGQITFTDYLYNPEYASDIRDLFFETIREFNNEDLDFHYLYKLLDEENNLSYKALVGIHNNKYINEDRLYVNSNNSLHFPHRFYLGKIDSIDKFKENLKSCFPNLIFHERTQHSLNVFNNITEHSYELIRHLSVLNDFAKKLYIEIGGASDEIYNRLKIEYKIITSGRGSNEGLKKYLCEFRNNNGHLEDVRCNPHTKLYNSYSDFRIYFNWGRESIENGKILIGHIGNHWND